MTVDPTPPSGRLPEGSTEAVRGGTKTKFNMVALVGGLILVIIAFGVIWARNSDDLASTRPEIGGTKADAAVFDTPLQPAKGDSPVDGDAVDALNTRKDSPSDPTP
jgi:hypothetical protein